MKSIRSSNHRSQSTQATELTRREFTHKMSVAALGAGALLSPDVASSGSTTASDDMKYRTLGKTGIRVSEMGFGSHVTQENRDDPKAREAQIRKGLELGINLFDIYEHNIHQFDLMSEVLGPVRKDVVISLVAVQNDTMAEIEFALNTFNTDYIDLYRIYSGGASGTASLARFEALQRAKEQGKIRAIGATNHDQERLLEILSTYPELDYLLVPYNFRHQRLSPVNSVKAASGGQVKSRESAARAPKAVRQTVDCFFEPCDDPDFPSRVREAGVGLIGIKPFAGGALLKLQPSDPLLAELKGVEASLPQAALRLILEAKEISSTIPAMNSIDEIVENVGATQRDGLCESDVRLLQIYAQAAEQSQGAYLPEKYKWLEGWKT